MVSVCVTLTIYYLIIMAEEVATRAASNAHSSTPVVILLVVVASVLVRVPQLLVWYYSNGGSVVVGVDGSIVNTLLIGTWSDPTRVASYWQNMVRTRDLSYSLIGLWAYCTDSVSMRLIIEFALELVIFGLLMYLGQDTKVGKERGDESDGSNSFKVANVGAALYLINPTMFLVYLMHVISRTSHHLVDCSICLLPKRCFELSVVLFCVAVMSLSRASSTSVSCRICMAFLLIFAFVCLCAANIQFAVCLLPVAATLSVGRLWDSQSKSSVKSCVTHLCWGLLYVFIAGVAWIPLILRHADVDADQSAISWLSYFNHLFTSSNKATPIVKPGVSVWWYLQAQLFSQHLDYFALLLTVQPMMFAFPIYWTFFRSHPLESVSLALV
jgi:hypothetical protein